jgi:hypothetical protein
MRVQGERPHRVLSFASQVQRGAAGDQHAKRFGRRQDLGDERRRLEDLLEVVEDEQRRGAVPRGLHPPRQIRHRGVDEPQGLGNRRRDETSIPDCRQRHEHHARRAIGRDLPSDFQCQPRLAGSARPGECNEASGAIRQPLPERFEIVLAADKRRRRQWQRETPELIEVRSRRRRPGGRQKTIPGGTGQVQRGRQRLHRVHLRPPPLPTLQRAHGVDRESGNGGELLLREARRFAQRLELGPERPRIGWLHGASE